MEKFNESMQNFITHHSWDPMFFVTQFTDRLHSDIRVAILLHRPKDLDIVIALACLQEDVLETMRWDAHQSRFPIGDDRRCGRHCLYRPHQENP